MRAFERLLKYVKYNTQSSHESQTYPSTSSQLILGKELVKELTDLGVQASMDQYGYVIGKIPSNTQLNVPKLALIAHMDTSPDASGESVSPRIIEKYDGNDIILNPEKKIVLSPKVFKYLSRNIGQDLIVTDGTTLLGADDKAGVAEIMTIVEWLQSEKNVIHGEIIVVFTPDEEVGRGTDYLDLDKVGADFGYTLDGSPAGEITYENFNAASATLTFNGKSVHPGSAKNTMVNSIHLAVEFDSLLPKFMRPEITEKYEGFNHLTEIKGITEQTIAKYIIRNHSKVIFEKQKTDFAQVRDFMNLKYGENTCILDISDSYYNMKSILEKHPRIIDIALESIRETGLTPYVEPIRGGTDGARLTFMGLPCPNLGTGGYNYHGPFEYVSIQEMDQSVEVVKKIIQKVALKEKCR